MIIPRMPFVEDGTPRCRVFSSLPSLPADNSHYTITGTREGYFEDNKGHRWMMIEEGAWTTVMPPAVGEPTR